MTVVYDAGALVAAERSQREVWADHRVRLELGFVPATTAPVVGQVSRSAKQAQLRRFLRGCEIIPFADDDAHEVGALAGRAGTTDVVDVHVVVIARRRGFGIVTSDQDDLGRIVSAAGRRIPLTRV